MAAKKSLACGLLKTGMQNFGFSYTTNIRKVTKNRGHFPNDEAMSKLLYLALKNIAKKWTMLIRDWKSALNQFSIMFHGRLPIF